MQNLINLAAESSGNIGEFKLGTAFGGLTENVTGNFVGVNDSQIAIDDHASAAQFAQDVREHGVVGDQLVVEGYIAKRQTQFLQQMEYEFQFLISQGFARDPRIQCEHSDQSPSAKYRNSDLSSKQLKFLLHFHHDAAPLWNVAPARPSHVNDLLSQLIEV